MKGNSNSTKSTAQRHFEEGVRHHADADNLSTLQIAAHHYEEAAKLGHAAAQYNLALMYERGEGKNCDLLKAITFYSAAVRKGLPEAQYNLARIYHLGAGAFLDIGLATQLYESASRNGVVAAHNNLALIYAARGEQARALQLFRKAARANYPEAILNLGLHSYESARTNSAVRKALQLLETAFKLGLPDAAYHLGEIYLNGEKVEANREKGIALLMQAAVKGHRLAFERLTASGLSIPAQGNFTPPHAGEELQERASQLDFQPIDRTTSEGLATAQEETQPSLVTDWKHYIQTQSEATFHPEV